MLIFCAVLGLGLPLVLIGVGIDQLVKEKRRTAALPPSEGPQAPPPRGPGVLMVVIGVLQLGAMAVLGAVLAVLGQAFHDLLNLDFTKGRLLRIEGRARLARRRRGEGWREPLTLTVSGVPPLERATLGELWHLAARMEHASIPAFSKLSLQLVGLGAPSELVARCHEAALDEVEHARACFAVASAYAQQPWAAGAIPELLGPRSAQARPARGEALRHLAVASFIDGCLGEGLAAEAARRAAERARDPVIKEVLSRIATDELAHEALAADIVAFCCAEGGAPVSAAVEEARAGLTGRETPEVPPLFGLSEDTLAHHGLLTQAELHAVFLETVQRLQTAPRRSAAA